MSHKIWSNEKWHKLALSSPWISSLYLWNTRAGVEPKKRLFYGVWCIHSPFWCTWLCIQCWEAAVLLATLAGPLELLVLLFDIWSISFVCLSAPRKGSFFLCHNTARVNSLGDGNRSESLQEDNAWEDRFKLNKKADFISLLGNKLTRLVICF